MPMSNIDKSTVVQECKIFNDIEVCALWRRYSGDNRPSCVRRICVTARAQIDSARCCELLTKILYLIQQGDRTGFFCSVLIAVL